jgi:hypothetical protein
MAWKRRLPRVLAVLVGWPSETSLWSPVWALAGLWILNVSPP